MSAQRLGLNTCWVGMTYSKVEGAFEAERDEKLCAVIAVGYGRTQGFARKSKSPKEVTLGLESAPAWFWRGVEAALLAPSALNQQKFIFSLVGERVRAESRMGFYAKMDLGIAKYHFEVGAGKENFSWAL